MLVTCYFRFQSYQLRNTECERSVYASETTLSGATGKTVLFMLGSSRRLMYPITNTAAYEIRKTAQDIACELKILYGITDRSTLLKIPIKF